MVGRLALHPAVYFTLHTDLHFRAIPELRIEQFLRCCLYLFAESCAVTGAPLKESGLREDPMSVSLGPATDLIFPHDQPLPPLHVPLPAVAAPTAAAEAAGGAHASNTPVGPGVRSNGDDAEVSDGDRIALLSAVRQVEVSYSRLSNGAVANDGDQSTADVTLNGPRFGTTYQRCRQA